MLKKLITWIFPASSEFEYIFFITFLLSNFGVFLSQNPLFWNAVVEMSVENVWQFGIQFLGVCILLLGLAWDAFKLVRNKHMTDSKSKSRYVLLPAYIMMLVALAQVSVTSIVEDSEGMQPAVMQQVVYWLILIRSLVIFGIAQFSTPRVERYLSERYSDAQVTPLDALVVVSVGVACSLSLPLFDSWLSGFIIAYFIGSMVVQTYRKLLPRTSHA